MLRTEGRQVVATPSILVATIENFLRVRFVFDLAASPGNQVAEHYFCDQDGKRFEDDHQEEELLEAARDLYWHSGDSWPWRARAWLNPPYGSIPQFLETLKAFNVPTVCLLPARTDSKWFSAIDVLGVIFLRGRIKFDGYQGSPAFGSMLYFHRCWPPGGYGGNWNWKEHFLREKDDIIQSGRAAQIDALRAQNG